MANIRTATTEWNGSLEDGSGEVTLETSGVGTFPITWKARAQSADGKTSPEELIAAAHSACFSMALSHMLGEAGIVPESITTSANVDFVPGTGITTSALSVEAKIPGIEKEQFTEIANKAKENCPVSQALSGINITLETKLEN